MYKSEASKKVETCIKKYISGCDLIYKIYFLKCSSDCSFVYITVLQFIGQKILSSRLIWRTIEYKISSHKVHLWNKASLLHHFAKHFNRYLGTQKNDWINMINIVKNKCASFKFKEHNWYKNKDCILSLFLPICAN